MRIISVCALLCCVALASSCSSISYSHDYDEGASFSRYKTFGWLPQDGGSGGDARQAEQSSSLLGKRIRNAVNSQLSAKGMYKDDDNPDVWLVYHTGLEDKINVTDWGYTYTDRYYYRGVPEQDVTVTQYTEGTLIIDVIEARSMELVWRASATGTVDPNPNPEKIEKKVNDVVKKMFSKYPPK